MRYNDVRKFGRMQLIITGTERQVTGIKKLGPEPNTSEFSQQYLIDNLKKKHKNMLTTQIKRDNIQTPNK